MINERNFDGAKRVAGRVKAALALALGLVVGLALNDSSRPADAQAPGGEENMTFRDYATDYAAPRITTDATGMKTKFSRPLEVPPLYAFDSALDAQGGRQIVVVDSQTKHIAVYWIRPRDRVSTIELVASRDFELDLTLENFNGEGLPPSQIREQREEGKTQF